MPSKIIPVECPICKKVYKRHKNTIHGLWKCKKCCLTERNKKNSKPIFSTRVKKQNGRPEIKTKRGWKFLHVYIMECFLGRPLEKGEIVHHCGHNKLNNKIWNLELMLNGCHTKYHSVGSQRTKKQRLHISRSKRGKASKKRSLSFKNAEKIRMDYKTMDITYVKLAKKYKTTKQIIAHIIQKRSYLVEE